MLKLSKISKTFGTKVLYEDLSYDFNPGVYYITGDNGSGKTTLFNIITKLDYGQGDIEIMGQKDLSSNDILSNYVTYITQEDNLIDGLTIRQNISLFVPKEYLEKFKETRQKLKFEFDLDTKVESLSGGERKKVQLVIGLLFSRPIIILDEPDNHLDDDAVKNLYDYIINCDGLVLVSSHSHFLNVENTQAFGIVKVSEANQDTILQKIDLTYEIDKDKTRMLSKNYIFRFLIVLILLLQLVFGSKSYMKDNAFIDKNYETFNSDKVFLIRPPVDNIYRTLFATDEWFEKTPFYLEESFRDMLEADDRVKQVDPIPDIVLSSSTFDYDGVNYSTMDQDFTSANIPYEVATKTIINRIEPYDLEGDYPKDDAYEIIIPDSFALENDVKIGDFIPIKGYSDQGDVIVDFKVVGIDHSEIFESFYGSYQPNASYNIGKYDDFSHYINFVQSNTSGNNIAKIYDQDKTYYFGLVVEVYEDQDLVPVMQDVLEYDPYLSINSNFDGELNMLSYYINVKAQAQLKLMFLIAVIIINIIGLLLLNLDLKQLKVVNEEKFLAYGYSKNDLSKIKKLLINSYYMPIAILIFVVAGFALIYQTRFNYLSIISFTLVLVVFIILSKIIFKEHKNGTKNQTN